MKRIFLSFVLALFGCFSMLHAQNVAKNLVVVEIATGTWCVFCPGSALGGDDLVHNGHDVAIIENHNGDSYAIPSSNARNNLYNVPGYPSTNFDGLDQMVGGDPSSSIYASYLPRVNTALAKTSPYEMNMTYINSGDNFGVTLNIDQVGSTPGNNIVVHLVYTESHIPANWFGLTEINFVNRGFFPSSAGTPLTITQGQQTTLNLSFVKDPSWNRNKSEIVAFIQDMNTREIFQGVKLSLQVPDFPLDAYLKDFNTPVPATMCGNDIAPSIILRNEGGDTLTSMDINYTINGGAVNTMSWTGSLPFMAEEVVNLPSVTFAPLDTANTLVIELVNPNGKADDNVSNNMTTAKWDNPNHVKGNYLIIIQPDSRGGEITWDIKNDSGNIIAAGGPYTNNNTAQIIGRAPLQSAGCYEFNIYDSGFNGLGTAGYYEFRSPTGKLISRGSDYGARDQAETHVMENTAIAPLLEANAVSVFPNPTTGMVSVVLTDNQIQNVSISVFQLDGKQIMSLEDRGTSTQVDMTGMAKGLYLLKVTTEEGIYTQKVNLQ